MRPALLLALLGACSFSTTGGVACDSAPETTDGGHYDGGVGEYDGGGQTDADPMCGGECDPVDAGFDAGRGLGDDCNVFLDQCGAVLTCVFGVGDDIDGYCRMIGPVDEGDLCGAEGTFACAAEMACGPDPMGAGLPPYYCQVLCDVDEPFGRCTLDQDCVRWSTLEPRLGFCVDL